MATAHKVKYARKEGVSEVKQALAKYNKSKEELEALSEISQLAGWHCAALARHVVDGVPLGPLARANKHSEETLRSVAKSPAGKKYMEQIRSNLHDPLLTTRNMLAAGTVRKLLDWEEAWGLAVEAKDYAAIHKMAKEIGLHQVLAPDAGNAGPSKISLTLNLTDLTTPEIKTSFKVIEAEYKDEEPHDSEQ